ncbi:agamous-like mads-box protein agl62 [Phtheirospermum japonicum]|uniref:Agamous-like mads-box protein agl62 n=1 Tax=Phtheirospermum japonicum TaxID=374723 RepID=A0A830B160_9LAMI|nr:agamous-like mads-box protein agl62 [Phtheirospermum japonicum]
MKLIEEENARTATFSKCRAELFRKATELSILCGAQIIVIIFSQWPGRFVRPPNIESALGHCFNRNPMPNLQDSAHGLRACLFSFARQA